MCLPWTRRTSTNDRSDAPGPVCVCVCLYVCALPVWLCLSVCVTVCIVTRMYIRIPDCGCDQPWPGTTAYGKRDLFICKRSLLRCTYRTASVINLGLEPPSARNLEL